MNNFRLIRTFIFINCTYACTIQMSFHLTYLFRDLLSYLQMPLNVCWF